jgi:hypothetical protein
MGGLMVTSSWSVSAETVRIELKVDPERQAGADRFGSPLLYTPDPVEPGSSVSHFDSSAVPNLLMEPSISSDLQSGVLDLTTAVFRDIGWKTQGGAEINLVFTDSNNTGFNDPSSGAQRKNALRQAAAALAQTLSSRVVINVETSFADLPCSDSGGATLAQAGAQFLFKDFPGADFADTWYHGALAEALSGQNLSLEDSSDPNAGELVVNFNSNIDQGCLGGSSRFFYGSGTAPNGQISFIAVAMHELAHGLGFSSFVNESSGQSFQGSPDIFGQFTVDRTSNKFWSRMTPAQIRASAINRGNVAFDGKATRQSARALLAARPSAVITEPTSATASLEIGTASFGPQVSASPVSGELVDVLDRSGSSLACSAITSDLSGKIALIDRGDCFFADKAFAAQKAGARGVIIANNVAGGVIAMGTSDDPGVKIPTVMVSLDDGRLLRRLLDGTGGDGGGGGGDGGGGEPPEPEEPEQPERGNEGPSDCIEGEKTLCLNDQRFRVDVEFATVDSEPLPATAVPLTEDTGYFWFFSPDNVELVVKVLDACSFNDSFWVFAAGLTTVQVQMQVTDTETGDFVIYRNPQGVGFQPIQDVGAFDTCE